MLERLLLILGWVETSLAYYEFPTDEIIYNLGIHLIVQVHTQTTLVPVFRVLIHLLPLLVVFVLLK